MPRTSLFQVNPSLAKSEGSSVTSLFPEDSHTGGLAGKSARRRSDEDRRSLFSLTNETVAEKLFGYDCGEGGSKQPQRVAESGQGIVPGLTGRGKADPRNKKFSILHWLFSGLFGLRNRRARRSSRSIFM